MNPIVDMSNISKSYGSVVGVKHVDLSVKEGEFLTLLGPSGCGKSTLLRMLAGFEEPTTGTIKIAGKDVTRLPPQKRDVNMMFQDYARFPHMTVGKNIAYGLERKGIRGVQARTRSEQALALVGLPDTFNRHPHQLSGGQRQRVALARAIVREPKVILLDEPLSALDAKLREQMQVELKHMHQKLGITFIMVTHDQTEALVMSDRVIVMNKGVIAQDGSPEDIYQNPKSVYVADFIGKTNIIPAAVVSCHGDETVVEAVGRKLRVVGRQLADSSDKMIQIGIRPEAFRISEETKDVDNTFPGEIVETIYHGLILRTVARLQNGSEVLIDEVLDERAKKRRHQAPGSPISLSVSPDEIFLFDRE